MMQWVEQAVPWHLYLDECQMPSTWRESRPQDWRKKGVGLRFFTNFSPGFPILWLWRVLLFPSLPPGKCQPSVPLAKFSFSDHDSLAKHVLEERSLWDFKFPPVYMKELHYMIFKALLDQALPPWENAGRGGITAEETLSNRPWGKVQSELRSLEAVSES